MLKLSSHTSNLNSSPENLSKRNQVTFGTYEQSKRNLVSFGHLSDQQLIDHKISTLFVQERSQFKTDWHYAALRETHYQNTYEELKNIFSQKNIPLTGLKGIVLCKEVYPKPGLRTFRDIDLLIHPSNIDQAHKILTQNGYTHFTAQGTLNLPPQGNIFDLAKKGRSELSYFKEDINIEIHTRILPAQYGDYPHDDPFSKEDFLIHLFFHATRHHFSHALRQLLDIDLWIKTQNPDLKRVEDKLNCSKLFFLAYPAWFLSHLFFGVPKPKTKPHLRLKILTKKYQKNILNMPNLSLLLKGTPILFLLTHGNILKQLRQKIQSASGTTKSKLGRHKQPLMESIKFLVK